MVTHPKAQLPARSKPTPPIPNRRVELDENMNKFANLWPETLNSSEPLRDLGYAPEVGLSEMVSFVLQAHEDRNSYTAEAFKGEWWLVVVGGGWRWLAVVGGGWWWLVEVGGSWW